MRMKKFTGYGLIALPFVVITAFMVNNFGWLVALGILGTVALVVCVLGAGVWLISRNDSEEKIQDECLGKAESEGIETAIGDFKFRLYPDCVPSGWTMEEDAWRSSEKLDDHVHRLVSWMGRTSYVIEFAGKATMLPFQRAMLVSRVIAADESVRRSC